MQDKKRIAIVGGCGHVGIPLGLALAKADMDVVLVDINDEAVARINDGFLPFQEEQGEEILRQVIGKKLTATTQRQALQDCGAVVFVTGTPVDEHHNPRVHDVLQTIDQYMDLLKPETLVILRSTVYPGVVEVVEERLKKHLGSTKLAFCPERIVQGKGITEIAALPQIISASSDSARQEAVEIFEQIAPRIVHLETREAELAKLITNSWRYLEFAIANQFYMIAESHGGGFLQGF